MSLDVANFNSEIRRYVLAGDLGNNIFIGGFIYGGL